MTTSETIIRENESREELGNTILNKQEQNALHTIKQEAETAGILYEGKTNVSYKINNIVKKYFSFYLKSYNKEKNIFEETENAANRKVVKGIDPKYLTEDNTLKNIDIKFIEKGTYNSLYDPQTGVKSSEVNVTDKYGVVQKSPDGKPIKRNITLEDITHGATNKINIKGLQVIRNNQRIPIPEKNPYAFELQQGDLLGYETQTKTISDIMKSTGSEPQKFDILREGKILSVQKSKEDPTKFVFVSDPNKEAYLRNGDKILEVSDQKEIINKEMELFYHTLMIDLRSKYESLSYKKDGKEKIDEILNLMVFYVNLFEGDDTWIRNPKATMQQKEEAVKKVLREINNKTKNLESGKLLVSKVRNDDEMKKHGYFYKETKYKTEIGEKRTYESFYRLPMAEVGKDALDKSFESLKAILDQPGVKILGYEIVGKASTVPYDGTQTIQFSDGSTFTIQPDANGSSNRTLAEGRMRLAEDWLKSNYKDKIEPGYTSKTDIITDAGKDEGVDYNDPAHPEYKERSTTPEGREKLNAIFGPYQGVDIKVHYRIDKVVEEHVYEKAKVEKGLESYNYAPKTKILINDENGLKYIELSGGKLNQSNPNMVGRPINEENWKHKFDDMRVDGTSKSWAVGSNNIDDKQCVVMNKFKEYEKYSKEDPTTYPPISDPKRDISWVDRLDWANNMEYEYGSTRVIQDRKIPILLLDLNNKVHQTIYNEMKAIGFGTETGISADITDKFLHEKINEWTKMYVKDGIHNRKQLSEEKLENKNST